MTTHDRFEDRLLGALVEEHPVLTGPVFATPEPSPSPSHHRRRHRRLVTRAGVACALGAVAAVVTIVGPSAAIRRPSVGHEPPPPLLSPGTSETAVDAADILKRVQSTTDSDNAVVVQTIVTHVSAGASSAVQVWTQHGNPATLVVELSDTGRPISAILQVAGTNLTRRYRLDYRSRTYTVSVTGPAPETAAGPLGQIATSLRAAVTHGDARLVGPVTVDGRRVLRIRTTHAAVATSTDVDPATYLPVREVTTGPRSSRTVDAFRYLADTAASRAELTARGIIPVGFSQRP